MLLEPFIDTFAAAVADGLATGSVETTGEGVEDCWLDWLEAGVEAGGACCCCGAGVGGVVVGVVGLFEAAVGAVFSLFEDSAADDGFGGGGISSESACNKNNTKRLDAIAL